MLEKPAIIDEVLTNALWNDYGLQVDSLAFLPLGADSNTAVYRVDAADGRVYFFKLRLGNFEETSVTVPAFLQAQGIGHMMAPVLTQSGALWTAVGDYRGILYPFIEGQNGFDRGLSDRQWAELGAALRKVHDTVLPADLARQVKRESFSPRWRKIVRDLLAGDEKQWSMDPPARRLWAFMTGHREEITTIVERAEMLSAHAQSTEQRGGTFVLCHSDLHAGNVLLRGEELYIVDWDNPLFAPKERDLMFFGGWDRRRVEPGQGGSAVLSGLRPRLWRNPNRLAHAGLLPLCADC